MSFRRPRTRRGRIYKLIVILSFLFAVSVSLSVGGGTGSAGKFNTKGFLITFFVCVALFGILAIVLSNPTVKGKLGERRVSKILNRLANKYGGGVINDVIIPGDNGKTSQLDHILVSQYGIFVVETKNYAGRIYGNDSQQYWTQVLAYGNTKNKLYNPVKQNQTHIYRLNEILKFDTKYRVNLISVVVFVKGNTKYIESDYVYDLYGLKHIIENTDNKIYKQTVVDDVYNTILEYKNNPVKTNKEHVKEIKQMTKDVQNNICPRCGGQLVLRKSKDGNAFYGCSNYPRCKFIKKNR